MEVSFHRSFSDMGISEGLTVVQRFLLLLLALRRNQWSTGTPEHVNRAAKGATVVGFAAAPARAAAARVREMWREREKRVVSGGQQ